MKFAVYKAGGIGDALSSLPVLTVLRDTFPSADIAWLVNSIGSGLLWDAQTYGRSVTTQSFDTLFSSGSRQVLSPKFFRELREYRSWARVFKPSVFVSLHQVYEPHHAFRPALLGLFSGAKKRIGRCGPGLAWPFTLSVVESRWIEREVYRRNLDVADLLGCNTAGLRPKLSPGTLARRWAEDERQNLGLRGPVLTIHALGSRLSRRWPKERVVELSRSISRRHGFEIALIGAPNEREELKSYAAEVPGSAVVAPSDLERAAAWLSLSGLVVGMDSGIVHMATALDVPTVALFGPGEHQQWAYRGLPHYDRVRLELPCWPCYRNECSPKPCLAGLGVLPVESAIERVLAACSPKLARERELVHLR